MIKLEIDREHRIQQLECEGGPVELAAEVGVMIHAMCAEIGSINPLAGLMLKTSLQACMTEDSPVWSIDEGYEANPKSQVIAMVKPRRDDDETL